MNVINKLICLLHYCLLMTEVFPQGQYYISTNGNISNSFFTRSIYNVSTFTLLKNNNSAAILDSLICIYLNGDRIKIAYNYNDDLSLNYFINAIWYNGKWINSDKHTNTYNSDGNLESVLCERFNMSSEEWLKDSKDVYNYDSLGNRIFHLHQYFNGQEFINDYKYEYYFKGTNLVSSIQQNYIYDKWVNSSKIINTYTTDNLKDSTLFQEWINNEWVNSRVSNYEYDENYNIISILTKIWREKHWIAYALGQFEYDVNNNLVLENWQIARNNNWENWFRIFYEYDENNNLIHLFGEEWENDQWIPENEPLKVTNPDGILFGYLAKEIFLYYCKPTSLVSEKNIADGFNLLQNYPNPFNSTTTISFDLPKSANVKLTIYNLLGEEIKTLINEYKESGNYKINWNANNLPSSIYLYRLETDKYTESKKMTLLK